MITMEDGEPGNRKGRFQLKLAADNMTPLLHNRDLQIVDTEKDETHVVSISKSTWRSLGMLGIQGSSFGDTEKRSVTWSQAVVVRKPAERVDDGIYYTQKGRLVVFNHESFEGTLLKKRSGSRLDVENLLEAFATLNFECKVHNNLTAEQVYDTVFELSKEDFEDISLLFIFILSHGSENNLIFGSDGKSYNLLTLQDYLSPDVCQGLAGKPKCIFINACKGKLFSVETTLMPDENLPGDEILSIPSQSDFLVAFPTVEGFGSIRYLEKGSPWVTSFCNQLLKGNYDLEKVLANVGKEVGKMQFNTETKKGEKTKSKKRILKLAPSYHTSCYYNVILSSKEDFTANRMKEQGDFLDKEKTDLLIKLPSEENIKLKKQLNLNRRVWLEATELIPDDD